MNSQDAWEANQTQKAARHVPVRAECSVGQGPDARKFCCCEPALPSQLTSEEGSGASGGCGSARPWPQRAQPRLCKVALLLGTKSSASKQTENMVSVILMLSKPVRTFSPKKKQKATPMSGRHGLVTGLTMWTEAGTARVVWARRSPGLQQRSHFKIGHL